MTMTTALEGGEWSAACPSHTSPPGKTRYPFNRRLGGPQGRSGWAENLVPTGIQSRTTQPVVSRYNELATQPSHSNCKNLKPNEGKISSLRSVKLENTKKVNKAPCNIRQKYLNNNNSFIYKNNLCTHTHTHTVYTAWT